MIKKIIIALVVCFILPTSAQKTKDRVLLTIDNENVHVSEFLQVYNKNKDVVAEENKKNLDEYLELFINYKLKLKEAYDLKLDTVSSYVKEYAKYKEQLTEPFMKDRSVTDELVREAYDRKVEEINASHILVNVRPRALPADTLKAYNKLIEARNKIIKGADFATIAKEYSQDPSAKKNGGDLGYFNAFSMVYSFENAAYATKKGEISMPFRTRFGYHIVKINDKRRSNGEVKVAHIMVKNKKEEPGYSKKQINEIYQKFKQGETFDFLAKKYSDDKQNARKGGVLSKFSQNKMIQPFADISFALKNEGDVSEPFATKFGWHFVKLIKKFPLESFEDQKEALTKKIEKGDRSILVGKSIANRLKNNYKIAIDKDVLNELMNSKEKEVISKKILSVEEKEYTTTDLQAYFKKNINDTYKDFVDAKVIDYYKDHLEFENKEFAATLKEYRDGLLLFDLLQKNIWTKAEKDTVGLQNFFDQNKSDYKWKERVDVDIASCTKLEKATEVQKLLTEGKSLDEIKKQVNDGATIHVLFNSGIYEIGSRKLPKEFVAKKGVSKVIVEDEKHFSIIKVKDILPISQKELKDIKGKVISDYQEELEKNWIKDLRKRYTVKVNSKTLKKLNKKYK